MNYLLFPLFLLLLLTACGTVPPSSEVEAAVSPAPSATPRPTKIKTSVCGVSVLLDTVANNVTDLDTNQILSPGSHTTGGPIYVNGVPMGYAPTCVFIVNGAAVCDTSNQWGCGFKQ